MKKAIAFALIIMNNNLSCMEGQNDINKLLCNIEINEKIVCLFLAKNEKTLYTHKKAKHGIGYTCQTCNTECGSLSASKQHFRTCQNTSILIRPITNKRKTSIISKIGNSGADVDKNDEKLPPVKKRRKSIACETWCSTCQKNIPLPAKMLPAHMAWHNGSTYICKKCKIGSENPHFPSRHFKTEGHLKRVGKEVSLITCEICGSEYSSKNGLSRHINDTHNESVTQFLCGIMVEEYTCGFTAKDQETLDDHQKTKHEKSQCLHCDFIAASHGHRVQHTLENHKNMGETTCKECDFTGTSKQVYGHFSRTHKNKLTPCEKEEDGIICLYKTADQSSMDFHEIAKHGKGFDCLICGIECGSDGARKQHYTVHDTVRNCPKCTYVAKKSLRQLVQHISKKHRQQAHGK